MNAIVLSFDRLPLGFLACYGNHWIDTPNFDRFAAQSATFHQHFAEALLLDTVRHAWWSGRHECGKRNEASVHELLPSALTSQCVTVRLLLEAAAESDPSVANLSQLFPELTETVAGTDGLEVAPDETPFFRLIARAQRDVRLLRTSRREPWLLWIKSRGVPTPWLPPTDYARLFLDIDDDDPADDEPLDDSEMDEPDEDDEEEGGAELEENDSTLLELSDNQFDDLLRSAANLPATRAARDAMSDFDRALMRKVLGGYVAMLDVGVGRLLEAIDQSTSGTPTLVIITAAHGLTVHEPGLLRDECGPAAEESVHVPLMIRGGHGGIRRQSLTQPVDIFPTLLEWFGLQPPDARLDGRSLLADTRGDQTEPRQRAFAGDGRSLTTVRTPDHYLVQKSGQPDGEPLRRLFAKPEDAWEMNDLAAQNPQLVDDLATECDQFFGKADARSGG